MKLKAVLFLITTLLSFRVAYAQKEWSNWYFKGNQLLTFKNGFAEIKTDFVNPVPPPSDFLNFYYFGQNGISYSDPVTGEMKFIISNRYGFNKNFEMFPSRSVLRSCPPDKLAYHIIPFSGNPSKFYVVQFQDYSADLLQQETGLQVRCPGAIGLGYSIVDLTLDGGLGDFAVSNIVLHTGLAGQMTTVRHSNGKDVWVIVHSVSSDKFLSYLFTDAGIQPPVETSIGPFINAKFNNMQGLLKANHEGTLLAGATGFFEGQTVQIQLFDFDNATGKLSNYRTLPYGDYLNELQFSPDDSKLYGLGYKAIHQFDFNEANVASTLTKVVSMPYSISYDMQLGPDGKIYVTKTSSKNKNGDFEEYTGVIQCPNLPKYACNFIIDGMPLVHNRFPDLINDFIKDSKAPPITQLDIGRDTAVCFGDLRLSAPAGWESYRWNTGETTRDIIVKQAGTYYVLTGKTGFSCPEGYGFIEVTDKAVKLDIGKDTALCPGTSLNLQIPDFYTGILWNNGSTTRDSVITTPGQIIISAYDAQGCFTSDTLDVGFFYLPRADFGNDTTLCSGQTLLLQLEPQPYPFVTSLKYLWQDGSAKDTLRVTKPGLYWGEVTYQGCTVRDSVNVYYLSPDFISLGNDTALCEGEVLTLELPANFNSAQWSTGETGSRIEVKTAGTYWVSVQSANCILSDTIHVTFQPMPKLSLVNDTTLCDLKTLVLKPDIAGASYLWQDGSDKNEFMVTVPGLYWVEANLNNCAVRDSITVDYKPLPTLNIGKDTTLCDNASLLLDATSLSIVSYLWQDGSGSPTYQVKGEGTYSVKVVGINGCINSDTIKISSNPSPQFSLGSDTALCENTTLNINVSLSGAEYIWNDGSQKNTMTISAPGLYWLEVSYNGCSKRDSIRIAYKPMPRVNLGKDTTLCEGQSLVLNSTWPGSTYLWSNQATTPAIMVDKSGRYVVNVDLNGCVASDAISVTFINAPSFSLVSDTAICTGEAIAINPEVPAGNKLLWSNRSQDSKLYVSDTGVYKLTVSNQCGSTSHSVRVTKGICELWLPNGFTPNNDGLNDLFRIKYPGFIKDFEMTVYNRFGRIVFRTIDPRTGWDGTFKGEPQPIGPYVWIVRLTNLKGEQQAAKGTVSLLR